MTTARNIKIGKFVRDNYGILHGHISGLGLGSVDVISEEVAGHDGKNYLRLIAQPLKNSYEVGAAFPRVKDGKTFYSVNLDSPAFAAPINAALFTDRDQPENYNLVWKRPEGPTAANAPVGDRASGDTAKATASRPTRTLQAVPA